VREVAAAHGLPATIEGIDVDNLSDEAARFTVASALDTIPAAARARHHLRESLPAVLEFCIALNAEQSVRSA
jgi:hypothetical protein